MPATTHISRAVVTSFTTLLVCGVYSQETKSFDRIFGSGIDYNGMTLNVDGDRTVKHDTATCSMRGVDSNGKTVWVTDLSAYGCSLMYFATSPEGGMMRCDVLVQFMDKRICVIRSSNGKMKPVSQNDIDRVNQKARKRAKKKVTCNDSKCFGVSARRLAVALGVQPGHRPGPTSPRADYLALGFPLQLLAKNAIPNR